MISESYPGAIRAIIFDLDNCIAAADEVGKQLLEPVFRIIRASNRGRLSEETITQACDDCWREPLDHVARKYGFPDDVLVAAWDVNRSIEVRERMFGYPDTQLLRQIPVAKFLVTSGFRRLQDSKIRALEIADAFISILIDAIDEAGGSGKQPLFERILNEHDLQPEEVLAVGDNPASELKAGRALGMPTALILRPGVPESTDADFVIRSFEELPAIIDSTAQPGSHR